MLVAYASFFQLLKTLPKFRVLLAASALLLAACCVLSPRGSGDVYMYPMFGSIAVNHHANPYKHAPQEYPADPLLKATVPEWRHVRAPYGPAFIGLAGVVAQVGSTAAVHIFQLLDALVVIGIALLVYRRYKDPRLFALIAVNPALATIVNGGHNDILIGGLLCGALLYFDKQRDWVAALLVALAIDMKLTAVVPVAVIVYCMRRALKPLVVCGLLACVPYLVAGPHAVLSSLRDSGMTTSRASLFSVLNPIASGNMISAIAALLLVAFVIWKRALLKSSVSRATSAITIAATFLYPYVLPWYAAPALLMSATAKDHKTLRDSQFLAFALTLAYVVPPGKPNHGLLSVISALALPIAALSLFRHGERVEKVSLNLVKETLK